MADEPKLPGETDKSVLNFHDLAAKKSYTLVQDVPVLDEHELEADSDHPAEWIGPERLQQIAQNNNKRINETGDACPITIGHTKDGMDERKQPPVVGYATNFRVHKLLNTNRQAIHADFHLAEDQLELVKNYPRRSVELWPKRWEIDPIALLGATTPERDLGLLQLQRSGWVGAGQEKPRRYRRVCEENEMAACDPKKKKMAAGDDGGDMGGDTSSLSDADIQKIVAALLESAPMKELLASAQGAGGEPDGDEGAGAPPMGAGSPPGPEGMPPGGPDQDQMGGGFEHESARAQEGPPEQYYDNGGPEQYGYGYGSGSNGYVPTTAGTHTMNGHQSSGYVPFGGDEGFYENYRERPLPHAARPYGRSDEAIRYQRFLESEEAKRVASLAATDANIRKKREGDEVSRLKEKVQRLERDKTEAQRTSVLRGLQAEGIDLDVAEELPDCVEMSDQAFAKHVDRIKRRYNRDPSGIGMIRPVDDAEIPMRMQRSGRMGGEEASRYARDVGDYMSEHPGVSFQQAEQAVMADRQKTRGR